MTDNSAIHVANYMLESILRDLNFLKENNFLSNQVYSDVTGILPTRITDTVSKPPLPTRKSTHSINNAPIPQAREVPSSFPKLPTRKTPPQTQNQPPLAMAMPKAAVVENEKSSPPPAYSHLQQQQQQDNLATAEAIYDYEGEDPNTDLSFKQGEIIQVTEYVNDDWWKGTVNGKSGIFPQNHVKKISPPVKAKRPWAPPTASKPSSFQSTHNTYSSPTLSQNTMPYSAPPPSTSLYTPPPAQPPVQTYAPPTFVQSSAYVPPTTYAQPPPVVVANQTTEEHGGDGKVQNMAKKFGGHVATAATWGFGATLGSQAANAIF